MSERRVAVTGAGVVSPLGCSFDEFHAALCEARPGIRRLSPDTAQGSGVQVGAAIDWQPTAHFKEGEAANLDRASQFALVASAQAIAASGLDVSTERERIGVYWERGSAAPPRSRRLTSRSMARANGACDPSPSSWR